MKPGSLVECIKPHEEVILLPAIAKGEQFEVDEIVSCPCGNCEKRLQFVGMKKEKFLWMDLGYKMSHFQELIPPIENIEEYINKNTVERIEPCRIAEEELEEVNLQ